MVRYLQTIRALHKMNLINLDVFIADLGLAVRQEQLAIIIRRTIFRLLNRGGSFDFENYHPFESVGFFLMHFITLYIYQDFIYYRL